MFNIHKLTFVVVLIISLSATCLAQDVGDLGESISSGDYKAVYNHLNQKDYSSKEEIIASADVIFSLAHNIKIEPDINAKAIFGKMLQDYYNLGKKLGMSEGSDVDTPVAASLCLLTMRSALVARQAFRSGLDEFSPQTRVQLLLDNGHIMLELNRTFSQMAYQFVSKYSKIKDVAIRKEFLTLFSECLIEYDLAKQFAGSELYDAFINSTKSEIDPELKTLINGILDLAKKTDE